MDRREVFGILGGLAFGAAARADHGSKPAAAAADPPHATPMTGPHAHFCGIHCAKKDPKLQFVVQHYCAAHSGDGHGGDLFQCVLFDGAGKNAKLLGVEYIVSDEVYRKLSDDEKKYWHPHTYEVLAGGLIAPGMDPETEQKFMKMVMTTWGKTWHTWPDPKSPVPVGEPMLIWALTGDGQADEAVIAARDREFNVKTSEIRERRGKEIGFEVPQVSQPKSMDGIGRQWTDDGEDKPKPKR